MLPSPSWGVEYVPRGAARVGFGSAFSALLTPSSARQLAFFSADRRRASGRGGQGSASPAQVGLDAAARAAASAAESLTTAKRRRPPS